MNTANPRQPNLDKQPPHPAHDAMQAKPHEDGQAARRRPQEKPEHGKAARHLQERDDRRPH